MGMISDFVESPLGGFLFYLFLIILIIWAITKMMVGRPLGEVVMEFLRGRPINLDDIDAEVQARIYDESKISCKISDDQSVRYLYLKPTDDRYYTSIGGKNRVGIVKGIASYTTHIQVLIKRRRLSFRKYIFICPPDMLLSSPSSRHIMVEGISCKNFAHDFLYPIPSQNSHRNENELDYWALEIYEMKRVQTSNILLAQVGETVALQSISGTATERNIKDAIRTHQFRQEAAPVDPNQQSQGSDQIF